MADKLGIIVPYRDWNEHLSRFVPHVCDFFTRDRHNSGLDVRIVIVEQPAGLPFNRGLMRNIGHRIVRDHTDFVCFHDVDYLPLSADYSRPALPTMIIRDGFEFQPMDPADPQKGRIRLNVPALFSAVVVLQNEHFERANGYSNDYWGWGYEDLDLKQRLAAVGLSTAHRDGAFEPLLHAHGGGNPDGTPTQDKLTNNEQMLRRWSQPNALWRQEGLSTADFSIAARETITPPEGSRPILVERAVVQFAHQAPARAAAATAAQMALLRGSGDSSIWIGVRRNAPCPCGSGQRFKHCHGRYA
jgi:hypothetical protein